MSTFEPNDLRHILPTSEAKWEGSWCCCYWVPDKPFAPFGGPGLFLKLYSAATRPEVTLMRYTLGYGFGVGFGLRG